MKKYYGFDGVNLVEIGEFKGISDALEKSEEMGGFFYVSCLDSWAIFAMEIIEKLRERAK